VDCHQNPVSGGSSQFTEIRAGHNDANGNFVAATVPINDGATTIANRSSSRASKLVAAERRDIRWIERAVSAKVECRSMNRVGA